MLPDGRYYGDLGDYADDYDEAACLQSFDAANGRDGVAIVDIPPRTELRIDYTQLGSNAAMYLYDGCDVSEQICVEGADLDPGQGIETIVVFNPAEQETLEYALVLDADEPLSGGLFFVDVTRRAIPDPDLVDDCIDVLGANPIQPGSYYSDGLAGYFTRSTPASPDARARRSPVPTGSSPCSSPTASHSK